MDPSAPSAGVISPRSLSRDHVGLTLSIAALLALAVNLALWSEGGLWMLRWGGTSDSPLLTPKAPTKQKHKRRDEIRLGKDHATVPSVAWISYDSFKKLQARRSQTEQPALQNKVQPVKNAVPRLDPTPPAPNARPAPMSETMVHLPAAEQQVAGGSSRGLNVPGNEVGQAPFASHQVRRATTSHARARRGKRQTTQARHARQRTPTQAAVKSAARPTDAAKSNRQSSITSFIDHSHQVVPGQVVTGPGIKILTKVPQFSAVALASSIPRNPDANITFNKAGKPIDVKITRSTTFPNVDSAIEQCLYRWRATGKAIKRVHGPFTIHMHIILIPDN